MDMITPVLDQASPIPLYHQLYSFLKDEIQHGRLAPETKLPSKRKLSAYLRISQNTIQTAYDQLIEEGYVAPAARRGFFVSRIDNVLRLPSSVNTQTSRVAPVAINLEYDFSYHGVDLQTFPFVTWRRLTKEVINEYDLELLQAGHPQGHLDLRASIAAYLHQSRGVNCTPEQVVVSAGTEFLFQTLIQLLDRETVYGIENPGYEKFNQLFTSNRVQVRAVPIDRGGMTLTGILESDANVLCITPSHQFPSGEIMPIGRRIQILNWANAVAGRYVIEDDYDSEFKYSGKPIPAMQGLDQSEKVIYLGAFSKSLAPTVRVSYMVLPAHLLRRYQENLQFIICPVPMIQQKTLYRFIADGYFERHLNKMRNIYRKKRETLVQCIQQLGDQIEISGADAGLHLLLRVKNGLSEEELVAAAARAGVKVYGVSKYYLTADHVQQTPTLLIGFATMTESSISQAVQRLAQAWIE